MSEYKYLLVPILAWVSVQLIKFITDVIKNKKINLKVLVASGGMPSSHSSVVTSLMTLIGINEGFDSILFAIAFVFGLIVMYDAAGVRRAAGKQAGILNQLIYSNQVKIDTNEKLKELIGHTPKQVFVGALWGIMLGIIFA
ncbi:MAG: divergent PAP2 family protein [Clostridiales bacterium]|nr:divergent PAP2 family protein [Clostridiales bacterium]